MRSRKVIGTGARVTAVGTPGYTAHELTNGLPCTFAADVFSLGVTAHEARRRNRHHVFKHSVWYTSYNGHASRARTYAHSRRLQVLLDMIARQSFANRRTVRYGTDHAQ